MTWYSNDGKTAHQIDRHRSRCSESIEDSQTNRGDIRETADGIDHTLERAGLRLHPTAQQKGCPYCTVDMAKLTITKNAKALLKATTSELVEIGGYGDGGELETATRPLYDRQWLDGLSAY